MMLTSSLAPAQAAPSLRPSASRSRVIAKADAGQINPSIDKGNEKARSHCAAHYETPHPPLGASASVEGLATS